MSDLKERLARTAPGFQLVMERIAKVANIDPVNVFSFWRAYALRCERADQSPVLPEFVILYRGDLGCDLALLNLALETDEPLEMPDGHLYAIHDLPEPGVPGDVRVRHYRSLSLVPERHRSEFEWLEANGERSLAMGRTIYELQPI